MGDRGTIQFVDQDDTVFANVYTHYFGSEIDKVLHEFFEAEETSHRDNRYADPSYLAARFVVWASQENDGMGIGLLPADERLGCNTDWKVVCNTDIFSGGQSQRPMVMRSDLL